MNSELTYLDSMDLKVGSYPFPAGVSLPSTWCCFFPSIWKRARFCFL